MTRIPANDARSLNVRHFLILLLLSVTLVSPSAWSADTKAQTSKNQKQSALIDVEYNFDPVKLRAAADPFHFLRSFVDYFYLLLKANGSAFQALVSLPVQNGWCVGDAHPENFGALLGNNGKSIFTANDLDDAGPCPLAMDLLRLLVSTRLYDSKADIDVLLQNYHHGLKGAALGAPMSVQEMLRKSVKNGFEPNPKVYSGESLVRNSLSRDLTPVELQTLSVSVLEQLKGAVSDQVKVLDGLGTSKVGGGSGGLARFELLLRDNGHLLHLEIKEEVTPAIYPVASSKIPPIDQRIERALDIEQGQVRSPLYGTVQVFGKSFLIRPRFHGNVGVKLSDNSASDNLEIIYYEAYILGTLHAHSIAPTSDEWAKSVKGIPSAQWNHDVSLLVDQFESKFQSLQ